MDISPALGGRKDKQYTGAVTSGTKARVAGFLCALVLLAAGAAIIGAPSSAQTPLTATVAPSDGLNLRASASTDATIVIALPAGSSVTITGDPTASGWYPVSFGSSSGWVDGSYLSFGQSGASTSSATTPNQSGSNASTATVNADAINLRSDSSETSSILATLPMGTAVQITGAAVGMWLPVTVNGTSGWMDSQYLSGVPTVAATTVTTPAPSTAASPATPVPLNTLTPATPAATTASTPVPVTLTLLSSTGQPIAAHSFTLVGQNGLPSQSQTTDQSGHAIFSGVQPGIYSLSEAPNPNTTFGSVAINGASATAGELFELQAGGSYQIAVVDTQNLPGAATVSATVSASATPILPVSTGTPRPAGTAAHP